MFQRLLRRHPVILLGFGLAACSAGPKKGTEGSGPAGDGTAGDGGGADASRGSGGDAAAGVCYDQDMDTFGLHCAPGPDCDENDKNQGGYEICDGKDNDCDGLVDEFLTEVCVACDEFCVGLNQPPNDTGWTPIADKAPGDAQDVIIDDDGALTLARDEAMAHSIWVANSGDLANEVSLPIYARGSVSKLDSKTNRELARYLSVLPTVVGDLGASVPSPSRTAVDQRFDAYVANRANGDLASQQTLTKYANNPADCIDRNLNGTIDTSSDVDGDGTIDLNLALPVGMREFYGVDDECILWTVKVGDPGGWARALAVGVAPPDGEVGDVFVGLFVGQKVCRVNANTGALIGTCTATPGFQSYGAAADARGRVWFVSRDSAKNGIGFLDANNAFQYIEGTPQCGGKAGQPYGMTVDADNRVYFATSDCDTEHVFRYDHDNGGTWQKTSIPTGGTGRGVAVNREHAFVAVSGATINDWRGGSDRIEQFDLATLTHIATHHMPNGRSPVGIGVSFDGSIWAVNQNHGGPADPFTGEVGLATRLDLAVPDGQAGRWIEWPVGKDPYTYSDFIGFGLNTFADPKGYYRFVLDGCANQATQWRGVQVKAEIPASTSVKLRLRTANTKMELAGAPWQGPLDVDPANPSIKLTGVEGPFLEVEVVLATDDQSVAPRVFGVELINECKTIIE